MTTYDYLDGEETNRRRELAYGVLRDPPAPFFSHQKLVFRVARLLNDHAEPRGLGLGWIRVDDIEAAHDVVLVQDIDDRE